MRGVVLAGFMGTGKSTVARHLAPRLGLPAVDVDAVLVARFGPIADQFARVGEAVFRQRERAAFLALCDGVPRVVATGGGLWVDARMRRAATRIGLRVVLTAPWGVIAARVAGDATRPLADGALAARFAARRRAYSDADLVLDTGRLDLAGVVDAIVGAL